jgi:predicted RNase H-like HicB family nuclease
VILDVLIDTAEDGWIVAERPGHPGCVSQGREENEALENIHEAINAWLWAQSRKPPSGMEV